MAKIAFRSALLCAVGKMICNVNTKSVNLILCSKVASK